MTILKKIFKVVSTVISLILILFIAVVLLQRFSDNKISFFDYRMFAVVTGSMEPEYKVGDVLITKKVDPAKIKVGDNITYLGKVGGVQGKIITHQVIAKGLNENNKYEFAAKGLVNENMDPIVNEDQIFGVVVYKSYVISFLYKVVTTPVGFFVFIVIPLFVIIGSRLLMYLLNQEEKRRNV